MQHRIGYTARLGIFLFLLPLFVQAECFSSGYTVVFVNGIFNTEEQARQSGEALQYNLGKNYNQESVTVRTGYNPSHFAGLGDLVQVFAQSFGASVSSFDRDTILLQIHPEVTSRKVFLVGHSQGTLYTNDMYSYLISHGEPKAAVGAYNVATPANYVAGGGTYLTSDADFIIKDYAAYAKTVGALTPLPGNAYLGPGAAVGNGHNFIDIYLTYAGERIVSDIQQGLSRLKADEGTAADGCFTPPENGLGYKTKQVLFAVAAPAATGIKMAAVTGFKGAALAFNGITGGLAAVGSFLGSVADAVTPAPRTANLPGSHNVVSTIYGSSVTEEDLNDLLGDSQGGAVALAVQEEPAPIPETKSDTQDGTVLGAETETPAAPAPTPDPAPQEDPAPPPVTPAVVSVSSDGTTFTSFNSSPARITITFNTSMSTASTTVQGVSQPVGDCGDADAATLCIDYPLPAIEPALNHDLVISAATSTSGIAMPAASAHVFVVDTLGPTVTVNNLFAKTVLPTVTGTTVDSASGIVVQVLVNNIFYNVNPVGGNWSVIIPAGSELAGGSYTVVASSTDLVGNPPGNVGSGTLTVDLTPPTLSITSGPAEGVTVSLATPVTISYSATDATAITTTCAFDADPVLVCTGSASKTYTATGPASFTAQTTDAAGNATILTRNFIVE